MGLDKIQVISIFCSSLFLLFVIELIRRKRIKEAYALLWLFFAGVFLLFSAWKKGLDFFSDLVGIYYPPAFLFLILIVAIILILIQFSIVISLQHEKIRKLTQELGILREALEESSRKHVS